MLAGSVLHAQDDVPELVRSLIEAGDRQRAAGRHDEAIESYREAIRLGPAVAEIYLSLGALYHGRGELERSLETFAAGLEVDGRSRDLLFNGGAVVALAVDRPEDALAYAERALGLGRAAWRDSEMLSLQSAALTRLGRLEEALMALEIAARQQPGDPRLLFRLGNLHHQLGQREQAIEDYRKAIKKDRGLVRAYYNLGAVPFELDRHDEALEAYRVALEPIAKAVDGGGEVEPVHARAFLNLGAIYSRRGDWQPALAAYGQALRLDPELPETHYNLGYAYFELETFDAAQEAYERALKLDSELPLAYLHLGLIAQRHGELEEAVHRLEEGLPRLVDPAPRLEAWRALAQCRRALGRTAAAEEAYRAILEQEPEDPAALLALGRLLRRDGR